MRIDIYRVRDGYKKQVWGIFRKHHYLSSSLHPASAQYVGLLNGETLVCHTGVIQAAMKKGNKRVHRLVVLPDFQGIGIGLNFINFIADIYDRKGLKFNLITTTPALRFALEKSPKWNLRRSGYVSKPGNPKELEANFGLGHLKRTFSCNRITYSFDYIKNFDFAPPKEEQINSSVNYEQLSLFE